jgi:hypothetical protein
MTFQTALEDAVVSNLLSLERFTLAEESAVLEDTQAAEVWSSKRQICRPS